MPAWALYFAFGETFGINPQEIPDRVSVKWFRRWILWNKAKDSRDVWNLWRSSAKKPKFEGAEADAYMWAMVKDKY